MANTAALKAALNRGNWNGGREERILADMAKRAGGRRGLAALTDKAADYAIALAAKLDNPERHAIAPTGKAITFQGVILSVKESNYRRTTTPKMTVRVTTLDGSVWLAWGTFPVSLRTERSLDSYKGRNVRVTATLKPSEGPTSGPHFVIMHDPAASYVVPESAPESAPESDADDSGPTRRMAVIPYAAPDDTASSSSALELSDAAPDDSDAAPDDNEGW